MVRAAPGHKQVVRPLGNPSLALRSVEVRIGEPLRFRAPSRTTCVGPAFRLPRSDDGIRIRPWRCGNILPIGCRRRCMAHVIAPKGRNIQTQCHRSKSRGPVDCGLNPQDSAGRSLAPAKWWKSSGHDERSLTASPTAEQRVHKGRAASSYSPIVSGVLMAPKTDRATHGGSLWRRSAGRRHRRPGSWPRCGPVPQLVRWATIEDDLPPASFGGVATVTDGSSRRVRRPRTNYDNVESHEAARQMGVLIACPRSRRTPIAERS
jgi:hypothetical protein